MNNVNILSEHGVVDTEKVIEDLKARLGGIEIDTDIIEESARNGVLYLDKYAEPFISADEEVESKAKYKLIDIGYTTDEGMRLAGSFSKSASGDWLGIFIGTPYALIRKLRRRLGLPLEVNIPGINKREFTISGEGLVEILANNLNKNKDYISKLLDAGAINTAEELDDNKNSLGVYKLNVERILPQIYDMLLMKENWESNGYIRLYKYLKSIHEKVAYEQTLTDAFVGNGYVLSDNKEKCLINTGLIDKYSNDIFVIDECNDGVFDAKNLVLVRSKSFILTQGFSLGNIKVLPKPIRFYKDKSELIFDSSIEEFDLGNTDRLEHIVNERRNRFPEKYRDLPTNVLCDKIKSAVIMALRISERDYKYIQPMYNIKSHKIQYLIPVHLDKSIEEAPEIVLIAGKTNELYCVMTLLSTEDAYNNARLMCKPSTSWLNVDN